VGIVLYFAAPIAGHSRTVHLSSGTLLGALGSAILLLFIISRLFPGNKKGAVFTVAIGGFVGTLWKFWESVIQMIHASGFYVVLFVLFGSFIGFAIAYKYPLDVTSQDLLTLTLRLIALLLILSGTNNYLASIIIILFIVISPLWFRLLRFCCGETSEPEEMDDSYHRISNSLSSPSKSRRKRESDGNDDHSYSGNVPLSRAARKHYLSKKMDPQKFVRFHVTGADEYITPQRYQEETEQNTELELARLREELLHGKYSQGEWVSKLSVSGQQRMKSWLAEPSDEDYDE